MYSIVALVTTSKQLLEHKKRDACHYLNSKLIILGEESLLLHIASS